MRVTEVFNPGGFPIFTYNPRTQFELEKQFKDYLIDSHKFLMLTGPTKSGKTVLCEKIVPKEKGIWIEGANIRQENDFWQAIISNLSLYTRVSSEDTKENDESIYSKTEGGLSVFVAKASSSIAGSKSTKDSHGQILSRIDDPKTVALNALNKQQKPIIIDDFHFIPHHIQINIVRSLKKTIYHGLGVVLISVPHRAWDTHKIQSDLSGRVQYLKIPTWEQNELKEIANRGFHVLNIISDDKINGMLANESFGNPQLMQEFCAHFCNFNNITESLKFRAKIKGVPNDEFFPKIAENITSQADFELLKRGPHQRSSRKKRTLVNGKEGDLYLAILMAIANTGPCEAVPYVELRSELKNVLKGDLPQFKQVSDILLKMQEISTVSEGKPNLIEWDHISHTLYLIDPYFSFYLRWKVRYKSMDSTETAN